MKNLWYTPKPKKFNQAKLDTALIRTDLYNRLQPEIKPFVLKYWQTIREFQNQPINYTREYSRMEELGLGRLNTGSLYSHSPNVFEWNYQLKQLDRQLRIKI